MSILDHYWVLPMPPGYVPQFGVPELDGFCVVCGEYVPLTDPEASACPKRYLIPHAEVLPFVRAELEKIPYSDDGTVTVADMMKAADRGREAWRNNAK